MLMVVGEGFVMYDVRESQRGLVIVVVHCSEVQEPGPQVRTRRDVSTRGTVQCADDIVSHATNIG